MLAEIRGSCKQNREFANIAQKCFQNLANKKSVWSLCKVVQTKKTSHKVRGQTVDKMVPGAMHPEPF